MSDSNELFQISLEQFTAIQDQLLELKQYKYESVDKLNRFEKELTSYMNENQKLKKDLADLVVENDSLIKTITSMNIEHKEQKRKLMSENETLKKQLLNYSNQQITSSITNRNNSNNDNEDFEAKFLKLKNSYDNLDKENKEEKRIISKYEKDIILLQSQVEDLELSTQTFIEQSKNLRRDNEELKKKYDEEREQLLNTIENLRSQLNQQKETTHNKVECSNTSNDSLTEISQLNENGEKSIVECENKEDSNAGTFFINEVSQDYISLERVQNEYVPIKKFNAMKKKLNKIKTRLQSLDEEYQALEIDIKEKNEQIEDITNDRDQLLFRLTEFKLEHDKLKESYELVNEENNELSSSKLKLIQREKELNDSISIKDEELKVLKLKFISLEEKLENTQTELSNCKEIIEEKEKLAASLQLQVDELTEIKDNLNESLDHLQIEKNNLQEERNQLTHLETEICKLNAINSGLETKNKELNEKYESILKKLNENQIYINELLESIRSLKEEIDEKAKLIEEKDQTINRLECITQDQTLTLENIRLERERFECEYNEKIEFLNNQSIDFKNQVDQLKSENEHLINELEKHKKEIEDCRELIVKLEQQEKDKEMQFKIAEKQNLLTIQELKSRLKSFESNHNVNIDLISKQPSGNFEDNNKMSILNDKIQNLTKTVEELKRRLNLKNTKLKKLEEESKLKSQLIRKHFENNLRDTTVQTTNSDEKQSSFFGSLFKSRKTNLNESDEIIEKMNTIMEETLLKNMQLQNDIKLLVDEIELLKKSNEALREVMKSESVEINEE